MQTVKPGCKLRTRLNFVKWRTCSVSNCAGTDRNCFFFGHRPKLFL